MLKKFARFGKFLVGVREELKKVTWPTRDELVGSAVIVLVGVTLLSGFIGVCDFFLSQAARFLLR